MAKAAFSRITCFFSHQDLQKDQFYRILTYFYNSYEQWFNEICG